MLNKDGHILIGIVGTAYNKTFVLVVNVETHFFRTSALFGFVLKAFFVQHSLLPGQRTGGPA